MSFPALSIVADAALIVIATPLGAHISVVAPMCNEPLMVRLAALRTLAADVTDTLHAGKVLRGVMTAE
jgi:hypothetical protein